MEISKEKQVLFASIAKLTDEGKATHGRAKAILARAERDHRDMTAQEVTDSDRLFRRFDAIEDEIRGLEDEVRDLDEIAGSTSRGRVVPPQPLAGQHRQSQAGAGGPLYNQMFHGTVRDQRVFANFGEFARAVFHRDPKLFQIQNASGASEGVGGDGGFYVPVEYFAGIMDDSLQQEAIRLGATIVPMTSSTIAIPMFDLSNRSTGIATMEGKLTPEGATGTTQKPKVREVLMTAHKISVLVPTTDELLQDAPQLFTTLLQQHMTDALGQTLDTWFISGTGASVPLGILNAPCTVSVAKDASQVAATLSVANLANMVSRLAPGSWSRATWLISPSALAQLFTLRQIVQNVAGTENVGGFQPAWLDVLPDGKFSLMGRPVVVSDRCSQLGTKGDVILADLRSYLIGLRQDAQLLVDRSIGFKESEIWFRLNCRIDGQPALNAPITPRVGSATLSPFVTLDAR